MKIGVIADTHIPASASKIPDKIIDMFKDCEIIVHAGDAVEPYVLDKFNRIAPTKAVWGNMDSSELKKSLPEKIIFEAGGKTIGVTHGSGSPQKITETVKDIFKGEKLDVIIFGHTHKPFNKEIDGTIFFNPGSACDTIFAPYCSVGIIELEDGNIKAEIIKLDQN